jgi:pSer/pThr/pTyr-binding forkhead associated (FHA) protein
MDASDAHIVVHQDPTTQQVFPLTEGVLTIGREAYNDVILIDPEASRKHAQISFQAGRYVVEDLGSTNGTFVNGRQIMTPTTLNRGDIIEVGEMARIVFQGPGSDIAETMMRAPSSSRDATMAMPDDLATFSEKLQPPPADSLTAQELPPPPVAAPPSEAKMVMPEQPAGADKGGISRGTSRRTLGIIGLVLVLVVIACVAGAFLLDALVAPETLYCGPAQGIFELFGNLFGYDLACG